MASFKDWCDDSQNLVSPAFGEGTCPRETSNGGFVIGSSLGGLLPGDQKKKKPTSTRGRVDAERRVITRPKNDAEDKKRVKAVIRS